MLEGAVVIMASIRIATVAYHSPADRAGAEATFRSLIAPPPDGEQGG